MKKTHLSKTHRLILSIFVLFLCLLLAGCLADRLGELTLLFLFPAGISFVLLNPELMRGE